MIPRFLMMLTVFAIFSVCDTHLASIAFANPSQPERIRVLLDSDANNELDDQHAIAYLLLNGGAFTTDGITVNTTKSGGRIEEQAAEAERGSLAAVEQAIVERRVVRIDYVDKRDAPTSRTVEPVAVLGVQPNWYLWAYCRLRESERVFRLDRIRSAELLEEVAPDRGLDPGDVELYELINRGILGT